MATDGKKIITYYIDSLADELFTIIRCSFIQHKHIQKATEKEEKKIHNHQHSRKTEDIFLRVPNVFTLIFFCIISWSRPVMAMAINAPPMIFFRKNDRLLGSVSKMLVYPFPSAHSWPPQGKIHLSHDIYNTNNQAQ